MPTIYVSRAGNSYQLKLRDSEGHDPGNDQLTTDVSPGDTIQWQLDDNSGLASINGIYKSTPSDPSWQTNSIDLLSSAPVVTNGVYTGTIVSPSPGNGSFEKYKIAFMVPNDPTIYTDDPKLQMNA